jgi:hypothetical protein
LIIISGKGYPGFAKFGQVNSAEISLSTPDITDKSAQQYGNAKAEFRYTAQQTVTVYSKNINYLALIVMAS